MQRKAQAGYKNIEQFLQQKISARQPVHITVQIGLGAVIDADVRYTLGDAANRIHLYSNESTSATETRS